MSKETNTQLSRREREIMDLIYRAGRATAAEVLEQLSDPPSYSAVRALLRERARQSALRQVLHTFFDGSTEEAVAALLDLSSTRLSDAELERLSKLIADARKEGR